MRREVAFADYQEVFVGPPLLQGYEAGHKDAWDNAGHLVAREEATEWSKESRWSRNN